MPEPDSKDLGPIAGFWRDYRRRCVPEGAGAGQVDQTRYAFYAGVVACLEVLARISEQDIAEADRVEILKDLHAEKQAYLDEQFARLAAMKARPRHG